MSRSIYLDHAATSWPKPPAVEAEVLRCFRELTANPGRSGHQAALDSARLVFGVRARLARYFGVADSAHVVFTRGATEGINLVLKGLLRPGDRVAVSPLEHNAVMRPLTRLARERGIEAETLPADGLGRIDIEAAARLDGRFRLAAIAHGSNVNGAVQDVGALARAMPGTPILLDAAQTAGVVPIDMQALDIDLLAFTGHKGLLGPTGTGGLVIGERVRAERIAPLIQGGTGTKSESEEQPGMLPEMLESGTPNGVGIAGLLAAVEYVTERGVEAIRAHEMALTQQILDGLADAPGVRLYGPRDPARQTGTVALTIDGLRVSEVGLRLDDEFGVLSRVGLQCAPMAHRTIGTFPEGTVRLAPEVFTTHEEIDQTVHAVRVIANR